jgi:hypothetical protein
MQAYGLGQALHAKAFHGHRLCVGFCWKLIDGIDDFGLYPVSEGSDHVSDGAGDSDAVSVGGLEPFNVGAVEEEVGAFNRFFFSSGHFTRYSRLGWSSRIVTEMRWSAGSAWAFRSA